MVSPYSNHVAYQVNNEDYQRGKEESKEESSLIGLADFLFRGHAAIPREALNANPSSFLAPPTNSAFLPETLSNPRRKR